MSIQKGFTGISFPFRVDGRGGIATSTTSTVDFTHIKESITQILLTQLEERNMELEFGSEVKKHTFQMTDDETDIAILKYHIQEAIEKFEKRVEVNNIAVFHEDIKDFGDTWIAEIDFTVIKYLKNDIVRLKLN